LYRVEIPVGKKCRFVDVSTDKMKLPRGVPIPGYATLPPGTMTSLEDVQAAWIAVFAAFRSRMHLPPQSWPSSLSLSKSKLASLEEDH
jgi:hypothetical protein